MLTRRLTKSERQASWIEQRLKWLRRKVGANTIQVKPRGLRCKFFPLAYFFNWSLPYIIGDGETEFYIKKYIRPKTSWGV